MRSRASSRALGFPAHYGLLERRDPAMPPTLEMIDDYVGTVLEQRWRRCTITCATLCPLPMPSRGRRRIRIAVRA